MKINRRTVISTMSALAAVASLGLATPSRAADTKEIVYLTPGLDLPFWRYLSKGIESEAKKAGYSYTALDSHNSAETQLKNAQDAIARGVAGIAISPTDSSTAPSVLALAARAQDPGRRRRHRHQQRRICLLHHLRQLSGRVRRRRSAGRGDEGEGLGRTDRSVSSRSRRRARTARRAPQASARR